MANCEWSTFVSVGSRVVGLFEDVRELSGEQNLSGNVVHRHNGLSQLTAGLYRLPHLRVDVVKKRGGVVIRFQHLHCAPHTSGVPTQELMTPFG